MKYVKALRCRECAREYPVAPTHFCEYCFGPLEVAFDYEGLRASISRVSIAEGPPTMWRYGHLLPAPLSDRVDIGAGWTPMRQAPRLAAELGLNRLWLKLDGANPTHSFKDRVVSVALSVARYFGFEVASCASTGNLANAVAAHAAAAGMKSVVFIPGDLEAGKIAATTVYGGRVVAVDGSYDDANRLCAELSSERRWAFVNVNIRPYYAEGSKSLAFEVAEQLGWRTPDAVVVPVASGSMLTKLVKGWRDMHTVGLLDTEPTVTVHGAQAEGCSPIATAFAAGSEDVRPVKPNTVAKSLAIGNPADGYYALQEVRSSGGRFAAVPEDSVAEGMKLLARTEGVFTETAGGVTIAALEQLVRSGAISHDQETVALITGVGLKTIEALGPVAPTDRIQARVEDAERVLGEEGM